MLRRSPRLLHKCAPVALFHVARSLAGSDCAAWKPKATTVGQDLGTGVIISLCHVSWCLEFHLRCYLRSSTVLVTALLSWLQSNVGVSNLLSNDVGLLEQVGDVVAYTWLALSQ